MSYDSTEITCANCSEQFSGIFCPRCGQKVFSPDNFSLRYYFRETVKEIFSIDNRLLHSLKPLLLQPGALTQHILAGRQKQFIKPISLFIFVNLFFFFAGYKTGLMNWHMLSSNGEPGRRMVTERAKEKGIELSLFAKELDDVYENYQRSLFFAVIPLFAAALKLIFIRKRKYYIEHLIYSIHFHSAYLLMLPVTSLLIVVVLGLFDRVVGTGFARIFGNDPVIGYYALLLMVSYHVIAIRRVHQSNIAGSILYGIAVSLVGAIIMIPLGQKVLFWLVWFTAA